MPRHLAATAQNNPSVVSTEKIGHAITVGPQRVDAVVSDSKRGIKFLAHEEGIHTKHGNQFVAFLLAKVNKCGEAATAIDRRIARLNVVNCRGDCRIEFDHHHLGPVVYDGVPNVIVVAVNVYDGKIEVLGD